MKLNDEIKKRIDNYFADITAEELFDISVNKYGFMEENCFEILNQEFGVLSTEIYKSSADESYEIDNSKEEIALAA